MQILKLYIMKCMKLYMSYIYINYTHMYIATYMYIRIKKEEKKNAFSVKEKNRYKNLLIVDDSVESILRSASNGNLTIVNLNIIRVHFRRKATNILDIDRKKEQTVIRNEETKNEESIQLVTLGYYRDNAR